MKKRADKSKVIKLIIYALLALVCCFVYIKFGIVDSNKTNTALNETPSPTEAVSRYPSREELVSKLIDSGIGIAPNAYSRDEDGNCHYELSFEDDRLKGSILLNLDGMDNVEYASLTLSFVRAITPGSETGSAAQLLNDADSMACLIDVINAFVYANADCLGLTDDIGIYNVRLAMNGICNAFSSRKEYDKTYDGVRYILLCLDGDAAHVETEIVIGKTSAKKDDTLFFGVRGDTDTMIPQFPNIPYQKRFSYCKVLPIGGNSVDEITERLRGIITVLPRACTADVILYSVIKDTPDAYLIDSNCTTVNIDALIRLLRKTAVSRDSSIYLIKKDNCFGYELRSLHSGERRRIRSMLNVYEASACILEDYRECLIMSAKNDSYSDDRADSDLLTFKDGADCETYTGFVIENMVLPLGFDDKLKGTHYAAAAVSIQLFNQGESLNETYETIAELNNTSAEGVEKAIRYAIEQAWMQGNIYLQHHMFGNSVDPNKGKPTNAEFISTVVRHIKDMGNIRTQMFI